MAYTTIQRVRDFMGAFGRPKNSEVMLKDVFSSLGNFTQKVGTWTVSANEALVTSSTSTITLLQADNTYTTTNTTIVKVAASTIAGIYFNATTSASNYQAFLIDIQNNNIYLYTVSTGTVTTSSISYTGTFQPSTFYTLRVENTGGAATFYVDGVKQTDVSGMTFTTGIVGLLAQNNTSSTRFANFQANVDTHYFDDGMISTAMGVADSFLERRIQASFTTNLASNELYDWYDQEKQEMPYVLSRSFNTLPTFYRLQGFGDSNNTLRLRNAPVYSTILLEENEGGDAAATNFVTRTAGSNGDYLLYASTGIVVFLKNFPRNGHQNIRVTYTFGATTVPEYAKQLSTRYAIREILVGYGANIDGLTNIKTENEMLIKQYETYVSEATLFACVGKTEGRTT